MRYLTAGESHGPQLTTIIEGVPQGFISQKKILIMNSEGGKKGTAADAECKSKKTRPALLAE